MFRVDVPTGHTLRVSVNAQNDMATTELYVRHDAAPTQRNTTPGRRQPLPADQVAIIPTTPPEPITCWCAAMQFQADRHQQPSWRNVMPLSITDIHTDVGGDGRYVTVTIRGADFLPDTINGAERIPNTIVKLSRPGIKEYTPVVMAVLDATRIRATFDLTNAPHGLYDLIVENPAAGRAGGGAVSIPG